MYDFDRLIDRRETNSYKWAVNEEELPMWVADMDFAVAPEIKAALQKRLDQEVFGYNIIPESFQQSIVNWWKTQHGVTYEKDWILYCTGVVPAISSIVRKMTEPEDSIVVLAPVYNIFYNSIRNNQREVLVSELNYNGDSYAIDYEDLEEKLSHKKNSMLIFCNPHNPIGKIWEQETLEKVSELCLFHDVILLSDEIHCDLTHEGYSYTPMLSLEKRLTKNTIVCAAPTKAFNLAGLQTSAIIVPNETIRKRVERGINTDEVAEPNTFAIQAAEAAFNHGTEWLQTLRKYLSENYLLIRQVLQEKLPELHIVPSTATYLAWIDCSKITDETDKLASFIRNDSGLILSPGEIFGGNGNKFLRLNYACPKSRLQDGLERLTSSVKNYQKM